MALGVSLCGKADLGVSMIAAPSFVISSALEDGAPFFSTGVTGYLIQGLVLILTCVVIRRFNWRFLLTFVSAVVYGYVLDLFIWLLRDVSIDSVAMRWIVLFVGNSISAFGVACFFRTYLPRQVYEMFVAEVSDKFSFSVAKTKWCLDITLLAVSVALAFLLFGDGADFDWSGIYRNSFHSVGLGTVVTALINSPIIGVSVKLLDKLFDHTPLFPWLEKKLSTKI